MEVTVAKQQGSGREAVAERSWRQTPDCRNTNWQRGRKWATSVRTNAKSKSHQDTSGRARRHGRKVKPLPGEISAPRGAEKSAEAVVAMKPVERREERRAEGTNSEALWSVVHRGNIAQTSAAAGVRNTARCANPTRLSDAVAASGKERGTPGSTHDPRTDSNAGGTSHLDAIKRDGSNRRMRKTACPVVWEP